MSTATLKDTPQHKQDDTKLPPAHSLREAADTDNTLEGYAAMNNLPEDSEVVQEVLQHPYDDHTEISRLAHQYYLERGREHGSHDDDWYRAEREIRSRRQPNEE